MASLRFSFSASSCASGALPVGVGAEWDRERGEEAQQEPQNTLRILWSRPRTAEKKGLKINFLNKMPNH